MNALPNIARVTVEPKIIQPEAQENRPQLVDALPNGLDMVLTARQ